MLFDHISYACGLLGLRGQYSFSYMPVEACRGTIGTETSQALYSVFELDVMSAGDYVPVSNGRYMPRMLLSEWREPACSTAMA